MLPVRPPRAQENWIKRETWGSECYWRGYLPIKALGYDAGTSEWARANKMGDRDAEHFKCKPERICGHVQFWYPLIEQNIDRAGCEDLIRSEGLPVPRGSSCWYCPNMGPEEVLELKDTRPEYFWKGVEMERNSRARGGLTGSIKGLGQDWSWESLLDMSEAERTRLSKPAGGCMQCAVDSADGFEE